jgi:hypothetical protein
VCAEFSSETGFGINIAGKFLERRMRDEEN